MAGVDLATLRELMGHSHISTTMRYIHPTPEHKQDAIRKLQDFNAEQTSGQPETKGSPQESPQSKKTQLISEGTNSSQVIELAERGGFEPPDTGFSPYNGLATPGASSRKVRPAYSHAFES